ncbi:MAG: hypothetical protein GY928_14700 [Colwellia sp.]|nr:hypothetical protein [Colwellia sp.]
MEATTVILIVSLAANLYVAGIYYINYRKRVKAEKKRESFEVYSELPKDPLSSEQRGALQSQLAEKERIILECKLDKQFYLMVDEFNKWNPSQTITHTGTLRDDIEDLSPEALRKNFKNAIESEDYKEAGNIKSLADERGIELKS